MQTILMGQDFFCTWNGEGLPTSKLVGQNKNAPALPPLIFDRSLDFSS